MHDIVVRPLTGIAGLEHVNGLTVSCECCVLSGSLRDGPIPRPEEC